MAIIVIQTVAQALAGGQNSSSPIAVVDSGSNIANNLDALVALGSQLVSVQDNSGNNPFSWPISVADVLVLAPKLTDLWGNADIFSNIIDSAANVAANATQLLALGRQIPVGGVQVTDTAANILANAGVLATLGNALSVGVSDTAANIASNAAQLQALLAQLPVAAITVTDNAADVLANANGLASLGTALSVWVSDTAANVASNASQLLALGTQVAALGITVADTAAQVVANALALASLGSALSLVVTDSAAEVANNASTLLVLGGQIAACSINVTDNAANVVANAAALSALGGQVALWVTDTATNIANTTNQLLALAAQIPTGGIQVVDSVAQILANAATLSMLGTDLSVVVSDTAANINANLAHLVAQGIIPNTFILPSGNTVYVQYTDGQSVTLDSADALVFAHEKLTAPIKVVDNGGNMNPGALASLGRQLVSVQDNSGASNFSWAVSVADVLALAPKMTNSAGNAETFSKVTDSLANIIANVGKLVGLGAQIASGAIQLADTAAHIAANTTALAQLGGDLQVTVTDSAGNIASKAAVLATLGAALSVTVADSVANINLNQAKLLSLANALKGFSLPDGTLLPVLSANSTGVTVSSNTALLLVKERLTLPLHVVDAGNHLNLDALAAIGGQLLSVQDTSGLNPFPYAISVADVLALASKMTDALGYNSDTFSNITDTAAHVAAAAPQLLALGKQITLDKSINVTSSVADVVANLTGLASLGARLNLTVSDSVANINTNWPALLSLGTAFNYLVLPDGIQIDIDGTDGHSVVVDAADAVVLVGEGLTVPVRVVDNGANINLDAMAAMGGQLLSLQDTSGIRPFPFAISVADVLALAPKMTSVYGIAETFGNVTDKAANISANLDGLQAIATQLVKIFLSDQTTPNLSLSAAQLANDKTVLNVIFSRYTFTVSGVAAANVVSTLAVSLGNNIKANLISVADTAANLGANLNTLQANISKITSINVSDGNPVPVTAAQLTSNASILAKLSGVFSLAVSGVSVATMSGTLAWTLGKGTVTSVALSDTAAHVFAALGTLVVNVGKITAIGLTDTVSGRVNLLTGSQAQTDLAVLNLITGNYSLIVAGASAGVAVTLAGNSHLTSLSVADSTQTISAQIDNLQAMVGKITAITLTDTGTPILAISSTQWAGDSGVLKLVSGSYNIAISGVLVANVTSLLAARHVVSVAIADTASNVASLLDMLQANAAKITGIALTDSGTPTLAITAGQLLTDASALSKISGNYTVSVSGVNMANLASVVANPHVLPVAVSDSAAHVAALLDVLQANATSISGISLTDGGTPTLFVSATQLLADGGALNLITGAYNVSVSGVNAANLLGVLANPDVLPVVVSDSAANIAAQLDMLQANAASISSITLTDGGVPTLSVSATQLGNDAGVLGLIAGSYNLSVTGVTASNLLTVLANSHVLPVTVSDSAANVAAKLDVLQANAANISGISLTDGGTPTLAISATQMEADAGVFNLIAGSYNLTVSGVNTGNLASVLANPDVLSVVVSDSAVNVAMSLDMLQANAASISSITLTDSGTSTLAISANQLVGDVDALNLIAGSYNLSVSGVNTDNLIGVLAATNAGFGLPGPQLLPVQVSDSAANVAAQLDTLQANAANIAGIGLTDGGTPTLAIYASQLTDDANALALISGNYNLSVNNIRLTNLPAVLGNSHVTSVAVMDSSTNVLAALDSTLAANISNISSIALLSFGGPGFVTTLNLSSAQLLNDAAVLAKITSPYQVSLASVTANALAAALANNHVITPLQLADTAANVASVLDLAQAAGSQLGSIHLTDGGKPVLAITAAQYLADSQALGKILATDAYRLSLGNEVFANFAQDLANSRIIGVNFLDSAANFVAALTTNLLLVNVSKIVGIAFTDTGTANVALTAAQMRADTALLGKISTPYTLAIGGELVSNVAADSKISRMAAIGVVDTVAHVQANLDTVLSANATLLNSIALTGTGVQTLTVSAAQFINDAAVLGKISTPYALAITGETAANVLVDSKNSHVASIKVVDTVANFMVNLDKALAAHAALLGSVALTASGTANLAVTAAQFAQDAAVFGKITTPYVLAISGEAVAQVAGDLKNSHVTSIAVADSAANIAANLGSLQVMGGKLASIFLTDNGTAQLAITAAQLTADSAVLGKIGTPYTLSISGESAAHVANDVTNSHIVSIAVADTAAHINVNFNSLVGNASKLSAITLTDTTTPTLTLSAAQISSGLVVLNAIQSPYLLSVKDTAANIGKLDLSGVHTGLIEIMPTSLAATLTVNSPITDLNLSQVKLVGAVINEKAYQATGTELDIVVNGSVAEQLFFTHDTESQLQLLGIGNTVVHVL